MITLSTAQAQGMYMAMDRLIDLYTDGRMHKLDEREQRVLQDLDEAMADLMCAINASALDLLHPNK